MKIRNSCWSEFLKYMSTKEIGDVFTRKELHSSILRGSTTGIDSYRLFVTNMKFLERVGRGKYKVLQKFPEYVTLEYFEKIFTDNLIYLEYKSKLNENASR